MTTRLTRLPVLTAVCGSAALLFGFASYAAGARINTSPSIPVGLYWTSAAAIHKGGYVMFCPPKQPVFDMAKARGYIGAGFCKGGYGYMMKRVLAAKDDTVTFTSEGVRVNGDLVPFSAPLQTDAAHRPMPHYEAKEGPLKATELLLMSDVCAASFDGRYFGLIDRRQIKWAVRPILTW